MPARRSRFSIVEDVSTETRMVAALTDVAAGKTLSQAVEGRALSKSTLHRRISGGISKTKESERRRTIRTKLCNIILRHHAAIEKKKAIATKKATKAVTVRLATTPQAPHTLTNISLNSTISTSIPPISLPPNTMPSNHITSTQPTIEHSNDILQLTQVIPDRHQPPTPPIDIEGNIYTTHTLHRTEICFSYRGKRRGYTTTTQTSCRQAPNKIQSKASVSLRGTSHHIVMSSTIFFQNLPLLALFIWKHRER